jgi:hypothetical protein
MEAHAFWSNLDDALLISYKRYFDRKNQEKIFLLAARGKSNAFEAEN